MGLWGVTTAATDKPKFLPDDSNAVGAGGAKEHAIAVKGGWGLAPGQAFSGNDNLDAASRGFDLCQKPRRGNG